LHLNETADVSSADVNHQN